ncbi:MAG: exopolysaccharide biosynthesis protein [Rhodomicrobium sp.]
MNPDAGPAAGETGPARTSVAIADFAQRMHGRDVPLSAIVAALEDRGFGIFMILFALPNAVIPGISFLLGAPVLLFALQLGAGRDAVWLPGFLQRRTLPAALFERIAARSVNFLIWLEKRVRPRWTWLVSGSAERMLALYIAIIAAFLMTPVPFGNALPALGISFMSAGLIEKDGKAAAIGIALGFLGALYIAAAVLLGLEALKALIAHF